MAEYKPLFVYLEPASIPQVVAHIQKYLAENPIVSDPEAIAEAIQKYIEEHPEIIAVASVNGKTGNVVLTGSDININASSAVSIETQLLNLASMINNTGADITQIQANISQIYTTIGTIQTDVETNASNISALQTSVEGQGTRLAVAETDIDALESAQSAQNTRLNTAEGNISSLQTRMTQAETDIDSNESDIGTLQSNIQSLINLDNWTTDKNNNYVIFPNGLKICWGFTDGFDAEGSAITTYDVSFPINFSSIPSIFLTSYTGTNAVSGNPTVAIGSNASSSKFTIRVFNTDTSTRVPHYYWFAIGF